ncbi:hypothetical protein CVT26_012667 [Gymnopilus dilepis]|uniref:Ribonuclease H1 N-terminal domain-containing protein n=1 Tax=Gymnopilus dilepis TaxID=231916 RepID=A0A409YW17_9AGAR|nr:hypothetical protein CVT26_012667 [Gymnopilus dilepis]
MPAPPQTPRRMRVIGGITGGSLRSPSKVQTTTTTTTTITPKCVRVKTVVDTVETYADVQTVNETAAEGSVAEESSTTPDSESDLDYEDDYGDFNDDDFQPPQSVTPAPSTRASAQSSGSRVPVQPAVSRTPVQMKKVYRPTPPNALLKFKGPCYILTRAQETGLFRTRKQLLERIAGLGRRAVWERRKDYEDGARIYNELYNAGFVFAEPLPGSRFVNNAFDLVPDVPQSLSFRAPDARRHPPPSHFRQGNMYKYYVVTKGEQVGIFGSWVEASARVDSLRRFSGRASWMRYDTFRAASHAYTIAYHLEELVATPVVGGFFDRLDNSRRRS